MKFCILALGVIFVLYHGRQVEIEKPDGMLGKQTRLDKVDLSSISVVGKWLFSECYLTLKFAPPSQALRNGSWKHKQNLP